MTRLLPIVAALTMLPNVALAAIPNGGPTLSLSWSLTAAAVVGAICTLKSNWGWVLILPCCLLYLGDPSPEFLEWAASEEAAAYRTQRKYQTIAFFLAISMGGLNAWIRR